MSSEENKKNKNERSSQLELELEAVPASARGNMGHFSGATDTGYRIQGGHSGVISVLIQAYQDDMVPRAVYSEMSSSFESALMAR